jgi:hypothetical protein
MPVGNNYLQEEHYKRTLTYSDIIHHEKWTSRGVLRYPRVMRSKTYRGYVKPRITPNATRIQRDIRVTNVNAVRFIDR